MGEIVYERWPDQHRVLWEGEHERVLGYSAEEMGASAFPS